MQKLSVQALAREQQSHAATSSSGRSARTVYGGHESALRQTVVALTAGSAMSEHDNPGDATILMLSGRVRMVSDEVSWEARQGDLLLIPHARHSVLALEDAAFLLSAASRGAH